MIFVCKILPAEKTFAGTVFFTGGEKTAKIAKIRTEIEKNVSHVFAKKAHDFSTNTLARLLLIAALTLTYRLKCCGTTFSAIQEQAL